VIKTYLVTLFTDLTSYCVETTVISNSRKSWNKLFWTCDSLFYLFIKAYLKCTLLDCI